MIEFVMVLGAVTAFYGYSVMRNPKVWGEQGRDRIREENWNGYVVRNGQFLMYTGLLLLGLTALDVIFTFSTGVYLLVLLGGIALLAWPLCRWMHQKEGRWWPWPGKPKKK